MFLALRVSPLPRFISLFNLSHFERTMREPIESVPGLPLPVLAAARWPCASIWTESKFFIFGKMLRFTCIQQKCVCVLCFCFCFVKVKFVFLSNITSFVYLRACYVFSLNQKEKEKPTNKTHTREKCFVVTFL